MNFIILVRKDAPREQPLVFVAPDNVDGGALRAFLPTELQNKYHVHNVDGDQPTPVGSYQDILTFLKDDPT